MALSIVFCTVGAGWADDIGEAGRVKIEGGHPLEAGMEQMAAGSGKTENPDNWTTTDTALQVVYTTLHAMDWAQTLKIARNPRKYQETNPLFTDHPSVGRVNAMVGMSLLAQTTIAYLLPHPERTAWQIAWITVEQNAVRHNRKIGLGISFHF